VEVMATGTNGGAQEHVLSLATRLNPTRYDVRVISLSHGSSVRRLQKAGIEASVIDEPDDRLAVLALAEELGAFEPEVVHNHMFRAEVVGTKAALHLGERGCRRPAVISPVHSSRVRCIEDREALRQLTPLMDRLIVVSKAIELNAKGTKIDLDSSGAVVTAPSVQLGGADAVEPVQLGQTRTVAETTFIGAAEAAASALYTAATLPANPALSPLGPGFSALLAAFTAFLAELPTFNSTVTKTK